MSGRASRRGWDRRRAAGIVLALAAVAASVLGAPNGSAADGMRQPGTEAAAVEDAPTPQQQGPPDVLPAGGSWTVTLLSGDVVDVRADAEGRVRVSVRGGGAGVSILRPPTGEVFVIPRSVGILLDDVLELELFDVVGLIEQGYDDASSPTIPLIVQPAPGIAADAIDTVATGLRGATDARPLPSIGAVAVSVPKAAHPNDSGSPGSLVPADPGETGSFAVEEGGQVQLDGLAKVWLDHKVSAPPPPVQDEAGGGRDATIEALDANLTQIGADRAWAAGFEGEGIRVGVLDTGIDPNHPDVVGQVVALEEFVPWGDDDPVDHHGHGTHVASTIAGTGAAADGARRGVAPAADLVIGKVLDDSGFGNTSAIIAGMEWAAPQSDVVNMSLGGSGDGNDPLSLALDNLSDQHGTLFVVAAGNSGPASKTVGAPAAADRALAVGAVDAEDRVTEWSSRGPLIGSFEMKPEIVAPGLDIVAARAAGTAMGFPVGEQYTRASGTSMASPHVAGAAALLAQAHPDWSPFHLKNQLVGSAEPIEGEAFATGAGRVDIGTAVTAGLRSERDVVDVALPDVRTGPHTETVSWTNTGDEPLTVDLDAQLVGRRGDPLDAVTIDPRQLTIAPGATASATVTLDAPALPGGLSTGIVTATGPGDGTTARTPIGIHVAKPEANLTLRATPLPEFPNHPWSAFAVVVNLDDYAEYAAEGFWKGPEGPTLRVPVGRYAVIGEVYSNGAEHHMAAQAGDPDVDVRGDITVTLDAARAVPLAPTVAGVATGPVYYGESALRSTPQAGAGGLSYELITRPFGYPFPPIWVTPMEGDPAVFSSLTMARLQAVPYTARVGDEALEIATIPGSPEPAVGSHTYTAHEVGELSDLTPARGGIAVVRLPIGNNADFTRRALDAGVALVAFADETRPVLQMPWPSPRYAKIPVLTLGGESAARILAAGRNRESVTVDTVASPYSYDIARETSGRVEPAPVVTRAEQARMARIDERFHRDPDGTGPVADIRSPLSISTAGGYLHSVGPIPERRTSYVTPDILWQTAVEAVALEEVFGMEYEIQSTVTGDAGVTYRARSRQSATWLDRPQSPGPVGGPFNDPYCQPPPTAHYAIGMSVWLATQQEGRDHFGCLDSPPGATMTLTRDGVEIAPVEADPGKARFPVPAEAATYRLEYEQTRRAPYEIRSSTAWTFRSAGPPAGEAVLPLLVADFRLPLDTLNRPTGRSAALTIAPATGAPRTLVLPPEVWTSIDDGATWQRAAVDWTWFGTFRVTLPTVAPGTGVSFKLDARDLAGSRVEQTLIDAYFG